MRYVQVYVDSPQVLEIMQQLKKERFVKKVQICHIQELDRDFVGSLHRQQDETQVEKRNHLKDCVFYIDNCQIIRYILNMYLF